MKEIVIDDKTYLYKVTEYEEENSFYGRSTTFFYPEPEIKYTRKYLFFGPKVDKKIYKVAFRLYGIDIENPLYTKEQIKNLINKKIAVLERQQEIEKGEII